jgi:zinc transport system ATP-binding protein
LKKIIEIKDMWSRYESQWVLEGINFDLYEQEIVAVVGPNGGGKSTLLKVILGIKDYEKGEVKVFGKSPAEARHLIGFLPQIATFKRNFPVSVLDVVLMGMYGRLGLFKSPSRRDREKALELLHEVGMGHLQDKPFKDLSGGQQQRVGMARALASEPRLLLLDEPATGVDIAAQESFFHTIENFRRDRGISVIIVSHDISVITPLANRVAWLNRVIHYFGDARGALEPSVLEKTFGKEMRFLVHNENCITCKNTLERSNR